MACLGFEPGAAGWKARTNTLSYGGTPGLSKVYLQVFNVIKLFGGKSRFAQNNDISKNLVLVPEPVQKCTKILYFTENNTAKLFAALKCLFLRSFCVHLIKNLRLTLTIKIFSA